MRKQELWRIETFLIRFEEFKVPKGLLSSLWKEIYCLRIMLYPDPPLLRLLTHPINEGHRIFEVFLLTCFKEGKKKKKSIWVSGDSAARRPVTAGVQSGVSWPSSLSPFCQGSPTSLWARLESGSLHPCHQCSAALRHHEIRITKDAFRATCVGFWRNGAMEKSSVAFLKWLTTTQREHAAVQRRRRVPSHYLSRVLTVPGLWQQSDCVS